MMLVWSAAAIPFAIVIIQTEASIPLMTQPFLFGSLGLICYLQTVYYSKRKNPRRDTILQGLISLLVAIPCLVLGILYLKDDVTLQVLGILATILLLLGFIPQFIEIYQLVPP
jgi:ABC-type Fe3+ transport system permease subunit